MIVVGGVDVGVVGEDGDGPRWLVGACLVLFLVGRCGIDGGRLGSGRLLFGGFLSWKRLCILNTSLVDGFVSGFAYVVADVREERVPGAVRRMILACHSYKCSRSWHRV